MSNMRKLTPCENFPLYGTCMSTATTCMVSIGNHTHSSPIWEIIVLAIFKIVRGEAEYDF